jgi:hypothetical protein
MKYHRLRWLKKGTVPMESTEMRFTYCKFTHPPSGSTRLFQPPSSRQSTRPSPSPSWPASPLPTTPPLAIVTFREAEFATAGTTAKAATAYDREHANSAVIAAVPTTRTGPSLSVTNDAPATELANETTPAISSDQANAASPLRVVAYYDDQKEWLRVDSSADGPLVIGRAERLALCRDSTVVPLTLHRTFCDVRPWVPVRSVPHLLVSASV